MTYSTLKKISVASVVATMFIGTTAVSNSGLPFDLRIPCPPGLDDGFNFDFGFTCSATNDEDPCAMLPEFNFIGVDDQGVNNSQFFKMDLTVPQNDPMTVPHDSTIPHDPKFLENIGTLYEKYDIEALDSTDPTKYPLNMDDLPWSCLLAASGDNDGGNDACDTGCLYQLDKNNGDLILLGDICTQNKDLKEIDALAFRTRNNWTPANLNGQEIWGWSRTDGLFKIETHLLDNTSSLCGDQRNAIKAEMICDENDIPNLSNLVVEDLTWVETEGVFYGYVANEEAIYKLYPDTCNYEQVCTSQREIEALEYISPSGYDLLVMGYDNHDPNSSIVAIALNNPRDDEGKCNLLDSTFSTGMDIEGLSYP